MIYEIQLIILIIGTALAAYTDAKTGLIYDKITYPMIGLGLILAALSPLDFFITAATWGLATFAIGYIAYKLGAVGGGDVKLLTGMSILLPISINYFIQIPFVIMVIFIAALTSIIFYPIYYVARLALYFKKDLTKTINKKDLYMGIGILVAGLIYTLLMVQFNSPMSEFAPLILIPIIVGAIYYSFKSAITEHFFIKNIPAKDLEEDELISWEYCSEEVKNIVKTKKTMLSIDDIKNLKEANLKVATMRDLPRMGPFLLAGVIIALALLF